MSTARRDVLLSIEHTAQSQWDTLKLHELNAPPPSSERPPKFLTTFPFPYMNGKLHLGHGFSLTKCEFASRFQRMKGRRSLWPFGFHVTGTPIAACAQKIAKEMQLYGHPPQFPAEVLEGKLAEAKEPQVALGQHKSKRGKAAPPKPQWIIMQGLGVPDDEIHKFADPQYWLDYFTPLAMKDLKSFGCHVDFRRSFITTDRNPYFDRFVKWQFRKLREGQLLHFGKRYCVYSPLDGQPCADHDRASGEGVLPQEYTLVKLEVQDPLELDVFTPFRNIIGARRVILPGATLRPETVVGQTNCWVSPNFTYKAFTVTNQSGEEEVYVMTGRAARNLAYQGYSVNGKTNADPTPLFEIDGAQLVGLPLKAPLAPYATVYTLPMQSISEGKGTGVVMSVPSDSPDDYINFSQLIKKPDYRVKLGLKDEWVMPFEMIPIIDIPGELGKEGAKFMCEKLKIAGPNATDLLEEAKKVCYQAGFYQGVMIVGPFAGEKVSRAKVLTHQLMKENDECISYYEPVRQVVSRSGDECVVALCDQWYIEYGKEEWKKMVTEHLAKMNMFFHGVRNGFEETLNWLAEWPCSRTFGLGTQLPCDATGTMIIDSLSDSTIYMAYYTIAQFVHMGKDGTHSLTGHPDNVLDVKPEMFTDAVFDYIYHGTGAVDDVTAGSGMPVEALEQMRNEFLYWYPVDLRCSAKDLIQNHLTMFLYNHAAIWPNDESLWPQSIFCNGHIQVDNEKMAKSKGNFISLREAIDTYGADCTRLACADAGDSLDDANFVRETASGFIMKLTAVLEQSKELLNCEDLRRDELNEFDKIFVNTMNTIITRTEGYYTSMQFRMVLNAAFHELSNEFSQYRQHCDDLNTHAQCTRRYFEVLTLMLCPLAPHFAEHMWQDVLHQSGTVINQPFPEPTAPLDFSLVVSNRVMTDVVKEIRSQVTKNAKKRGPIEEVIVYTAPSYAEWQRSALELLQNMYRENGDRFPADCTKVIMASRPDWMTKEIIPDTMAFLSFVRLNVEKYGKQAMSVDPVIDDEAMLSSIKDNLCKLSGVPSVVVLPASDERYPEHANARRKCRPGEPTVAFPPVPKA